MDDGVGVGYHFTGEFVLDYKVWCVFFPGREEGLRNGVGSNEIIIFLVFSIRWHSTHHGILSRICFSSVASGVCMISM